MRILDHQQFWEYRQAECAKCIDLPYYDVTEASPNMCVQVGLDSNNIPIINGDFAVNPFNKITSTDFSFELTFPKKTQLQFYIGSKVYIVIWNTLPATTVAISGNVYFVKVGYSGADTSSGRKTKFLAFLNNTIDVNHSTTSSLVSDTFTIANIPANSYVNNAFGFINTLSTVDISDFEGKSFYWTGSELCFYQTVTSTGTFKFSQSLTTGKRYKFTFDYSSLYADYTLNLVVYDGTNTTTIPLTYTITSSGTITAYYTALLTISTEFAITLTDPSNHNTGFCFDNLTLKEVCTVSSVVVNDITNGIDEEIFTEELENMTITYSGDNALICINGYSVLINHPKNDCYQLTVTDSCENSSVSNYFKFYVANCGLSLVKLEWYGDCKFGDLDYVNLSMINTMYVKGYKKRIPQQLDDRITSRNTDGSVSTIFSITSKRYEFNFGKYTEVLHEQLERVFENKFIFVDDVEYYKDGKDVYQIRDLNNGYYLGGIELTKKGSEVIASACCC